MSPKDDNGPAVQMTVGDDKSRKFSGMVENCTDQLSIDAEKMGYKKFATSASELVGLSSEGREGFLETIGGIPGLAKKLEVNLKWGIDGTDDDVSRRKGFFGTNTHPQMPPRTFWFFVLEAMQDSLVQVLFVCAIVSILVSVPSNGNAEGWYDGAGIFIALFIIIVVSAVSNFRQSLQFFHLNKENARITVQATRGGRRQPIFIDDIVVGDVVHLSIGDHIPADGILVESHSMAIDESSMTGESEMMLKDAKKRPFLLAGCTVMDGFGEMLVVSVGMNTEWGRTMSTLSVENDGETALQVRLTGVATLMGQLGVTVGIALFLVLSIRYMMQNMKLPTIEADDVTQLLSFFTIAVTVLVIAIPEGLPLAVTLTLAFSVRKMMADKSLVRHLAACETMGSATTICSDKTGTLTLNQMTVTTTWVGGSLRRSSLLQGGVNIDFLKVLHEGISQNSSGSVYYPKVGRHEVSGSPTESAILDWGVQSGMLFHESRAQSEILEVVPFSSEKKVMGVLLKTVNGEHRTHWKGAGEIVLEKCKYWLDSEGVAQPLTHKKAELLGVISNMAHKALRTICLAYKEVPRGSLEREGEGEGEVFKVSDEDLTLLAIVGIKDPCRPEVPDSVRICQQAGIKVRMVTGDNLETAKAIALECGILSPGGLSIEGRELRILEESGSLRSVIPTLEVVARATPSDKLFLVRYLKDMGEVVAVTGDGTNDAPALHEADIGLAMGVCGTEVAKESADIVILDDNFASIVKTVAWGRSVYRNIQRFLQFQVTTTLVAIGLNFVSAAITGVAPLTAVQMLWVDLIQDTFGALALASEPPSKNLLSQPPVDRKKPLLTLVMWRNIIGQSIYQLVIMLVLWFYGKEWLGLPGNPGVPEMVTSGTEMAEGDGELVTIIFSTFVFCQVFNEINSRKLEEWNVFEGILQNRIFLLIVLIEVVCQVIIVEFMGNFASTKPINLTYWIVCILIGAGSIPFGLLIKLIPLPGLGRKSKIDISSVWNGATLMDKQGTFEKLEP